MAIIAMFGPARYSGGMEVTLTPDMQAKLDRMAAAQGRPIETLVQEAVARLVDYDGWFFHQVDPAVPKPKAL